MSPGAIVVADDDRVGVRRKTGNGDWEVRTAPVVETSQPSKTVQLLAAQLEADARDLTTSRRMADTMDRILRPESKPIGAVVEDLLQSSVREALAPPLPPMLEAALGWLAEHGPTWTHAEHVRWDSAFSAIVQLLYPT